MTAQNPSPSFLLFLDFDGVLHPVMANEHEKFRPEAIHSVNKILDELGAKAVLSTAWRMESSIDRFNSWFKGRIVDSTPVHELGRNKEHSRYHEIIGFLKSHEWSHIPWIAIDDKRSHFPASSPAYITNAEVGVTSKDAENIILIGRSMKFALHSLLEHLSREKWRE